MKHFIAIIFIILCISVSTGSKGQVVTVTNSTNTTPNLLLNYGSLSAAITALNNVTVISGPVTITLNPGNPQTTPAGGYVISFATISNTAASPVTITGSGNTITAFTPQVSGTLTDAIFKIIGADYITIQNFVMQENPANTTTATGTNNMTEWGVALLYKITTDGAQNNTIQDNTISLNRNYQNSFGIYSNTRHSATVVTTNVDVTNNTTGPNNNNKVYNNSISNVNMGISFIGSGTAANMDVGNDIGGNSSLTGNNITNWGGALSAIGGFFANSATFYGILIKNQKAENVSYNSLTSSTISGTTTSTRGIYKDYNTTPTGTFTTTVTNNTISITDNNASGNFDGIRSDGILTALATATININNNSFINNGAGGASNAIPISGIINTSVCGVLNINNNIFRGNTSATTTGSFTAISNTGAVTTTLNINNNKIGDGSGNAITYSVTNNSNLIGINCSVVAAAAAVSISNNNFQGFVQSVAGTGTHTYINLNHGTGSGVTDNVNDNTFTNLTANTSGNITFINVIGSMISTGAAKNCNNNKIITGFSKPVAGGTVLLFNSTSASLSGNTMTQMGNDFSNITLTGTTIMDGWNNEEGAAASGPTKTINTNTFKNWTCGSSVTVIQSDNGGDLTTVSGNDIENISGTSFISVIYTGTGNKLSHTISNNIIASISTANTLLGISGGSNYASSVLNITGNDVHSLTETGANPAEAIQITGPATAAITTNILKNKVYDINAQNVSCQVYGIDISTATNTATYNIVNNMVGDLKAGLTNNTLAIRGISVSAVASPSTFNIYYNTVYLNATSSGTDFGTAALYLTASNTSTIGTASVRNNIFVNTSTANGAGLTVAYRRSLAQLGNYASSSNNNIFYAGTPSASNLIFNDGTNSDQTLAAFKTRVGPTRESASFTELPPFLSTSGASVNFLHINTAVPTQAESGAVNIAGYTDDYDANIRQGNAGYPGTGTAPDIGADEFDGIYSELNPPVITYTALPSPICSVSDRTITGVNITDATGVPLSGANRPRIYYRKNAGSWFSQPGTNTSGTTTNSNWSFTIVVSDMGTPVGGDVVSYYIIAQDLNPIANVASNPSAGLVATGVNSVTTAPTLPNTYVYGYNLSGTYTVGATGNFTTLTAAIFAYNNACSLAGPTIFELIDNSYGSETFPITFNYRADANSTNTLTIRPSATATPVFTGSTTTQIINLDGAMYITFDGRQGGAGTNKSLSFSNTGTGIAFQFIGDAQNNTIKYCNVAAHKANSFFGTITFLTAGTGTGNDNNTIDNNEIFDATGGFSSNGIYSGGTVGKENDNITISNNNISNYFNATNDSHGIYVSTNSSSWTITGNRFFQTGTRVYTGTSVIAFGIYITAGSGYTITNNIIGYANAAGTGTTNMIGNSVTLAGFPASYTASGTATGLRYVGIAVSLALFGTTSTIDGNTVGGIAMYTSNGASTVFGMLGGIYVESGTVNIGANAGNTIGAATGTNSIYVATTSGTGTIVGIRAVCIVSSSIQNNTIGSITSSGTTAGVSGNFTGISIAGSCNYAISNNSIGNADADNIRIGYATSGANLSNAGTLTVTNVGITATVRGIISSSTGNTLAITNNTIRGWIISCRSTPNLSGIESSGAMTGGTPAVNVNNNFIGTSATNWLNATVDNIGNIYGITINNTGAATTNIKDNDIRGTIFGTQNGVGGGLIKLTGASSPNNIATISGNTFTNLNFGFSTGDLYLIYSNYTISSTGQLIIDNNKTVGSFNVTGTSTYHMISCLMASSAGAKTDITNNDFSNVTAATGFTSQFYCFYTSFSVNPCLLTITGNKLSNWSTGNGFVSGFDISDMTGIANISNNTVSNINCQGYMTGIRIDPSGSSGQFNITNNNVSGLVSTGVGGYINGITSYISPVNATQTTIDNNTVNGLSSTNTGGSVAGIYLDNGFTSATAAITKNKIYDLSESSTGSTVYGINNYTSLRGNITYSNNYIGDLRAPSSNISTTIPAVAGMRFYMLSGQANAYYNTIHLNASGSAPSFSTAAVFADPATQVTLRNNIFSNISSHGSSGRTIAYWRGDTNLGTYDATSNNNLFYAGTASVQNLVFYDGTNSDQTLTAYQTRVNPSDSLSVSADQNFISTIGSNAAFLHIPPTGNCIVNAKGSNSGILLTTDYDNDVRSTASPFVTDIGADEFSKKNTWTGANGTNWNDTGNWSEGIVPNTDDDNIVISNPPVNQPVIAASETYQVASIIIGAGANLTNKGTLKIAGSVYTNAAASINNMQAGIVEGSVEMNGNCSIAQPLAGDVFVNNGVKDFKVSNDVKISAAIGQQLNISGKLFFGGTGKTLFTNDNIVLVSTVDRTANVADVTGNFITGKATVERYVNTGLIADGRHLKSWQFLATPTAGQTIFQSWQESGTTPAGYGTIITGTGSGFDITTALPSMKVYDNSTNDWIGINNTANPINEKKGYMLFVRGDRSVTAYNQNAVPTTLRTKGTLYQPSIAPPVSTVQAGKFESIGNPYASAIDISYMKNNGLFVNLDNDITVWDPLLAGTFLVGGYQTLSASNNYEPTAGGTSYYPSGISAPFIQSGQAFFVHSSGPAGSVTFNEASKVDTNRLVNRQGIQNTGRQYFRVTLCTPAGIVADGNAVTFDHNFNNSIDKDDAYKIINGGENFGLSREGKILAVEARSPVQRTDTIFYNMFNLRKQAYQLRFAPKDMQPTGLKAFLIDKYLHTTAELSLGDSSFIDIVINNDSLSYASDRFYVVFKQTVRASDPIPHIPVVNTIDKTPAKPITENNNSYISVYPNPVENKTLQLHFENQLTGTYRVELINKLGQPITNTTIIINNANCLQTIKIDPVIAAGNYLVNIYAGNGEKTVLQVIIK